MPPKTKRAKNTTLFPSSLTPSNFSTITFANSSTLSATDANTLNNLQSSFTKAPTLPEHVAPKYQSSTAAKHAKIAYDLDTCTATDLNTGKTKVYKKSDPIAFILADEAMPGSFTPAAARDHRYRDEEKHESVLIDVKGNAHVICPAHGSLVKVEALQTDHADSAKNILERQRHIIAELNSNKDFAKTFIAQFNLDELFVPVNNVYQGTLYFYERYYNDIDNLWNICQSCNLHKNDKDALEWFEKNNNFGKAFITYLNGLGINENGPVMIAGERGLADLAIEWYRETIIVTPKLIRNVIEDMKKKTDTFKKNMNQVMKIGLREKIREFDEKIDQSPDKESDKILFDKYNKKAIHHKALYEKYQKLADKYAIGETSEFKITEQTSPSNKTTNTIDQQVTPQADQSESSKKRKVISSPTSSPPTSPSTRRGLIYPSSPTLMELTQQTDEKKLDSSNSSLSVPKQFSASSSTTSSSNPSNESKADTDNEEKPYKSSRPGSR